MKILVAAVALATAIASPALAKSPPKRAPAHVTMHATAVHAEQQPHVGNPSYAVYDGSGHYIGADPDPFIRDMMHSDPRGDD